ncbi:hypothetical protein [Streptomyces beihaiensis]|uniref:Uncharacterized protein n=1 Tax=Streptomyces beihaiensis TaxID=2984495 RepID=A0ABT3TXV5_9ACTN|nr:hypothetical protein [Streptomyces beihaiensis]MCX3061877.1 hypothetical protein [Streptomyces beihaiensis]
MSDQTKKPNTSGNETVKELERKVENLADDIKKKYSTEALKKELRDDIIKLAAPTLLVSIAAPAFWSSSSLIEKLLERKLGITRNKWGFLWRQSRRERRLPAVSERLKQTNRNVRRANRRIDVTNDRLKRTNGRVNLLEETVANIKRRANTTRQQVRHIPASADFAGETDRLRILELHVNKLSEALG